MKTDSEVLVNSVKHVTKKIHYLELKVVTEIDKFIFTNTRKDRDNLIKSKTELKIYKEIQLILLDK